MSIQIICTTNLRSVDTVLPEPYNIVPFIFRHPRIVNFVNMHCGLQLPPMNVSCLQYVYWTVISMGCPLIEPAALVATAVVPVGSGIIPEKSPANSDASPVTSIQLPIIMP